MLLWQLGCVVGVAAVAAIFWGVKAGWSALAGGGIGLIWTVYMALAMARHSLDHGRRLSAMTFVAGWLIKVVLTISLLILAFRSKAIAPLSLLAGLSGALVAYWFLLSFAPSRAKG
jgi:ATP synthase protein I